MTILLPALVSLALAAAPEAPPDGAAPADESYYLVSFQGRTIGKAVRRLSRAGQGDAARLTLAIEENYRFSAGDRQASQFARR